MYFCGEIKHWDKHLDETERGHTNTFNQPLNELKLQQQRANVWDALSFEAECYNQTISKSMEQIVWCFILTFSSNTIYSNSSCQLPYVKSLHKRTISFVNVFYIETKLNLTIVNEAVKITFFKCPYLQSWGNVAIVRKDVRDVTTNTFSLASSPLTTSFLFQNVNGAGWNFLWTS